MQNLPPQAVKLHSFRETTCQSCVLRTLCLPLSLNFRDIERLDKIISRSRPIKKGEYLFRQDDSFKSLFALRSGCVKTFALTSEGEEQITGFYLPSELVGLSGIDTRSYPVSAIAIDTTTLCEIPFSKFEELTESIPDLKRQLINSMSKEIRADLQMITLLSKKNAGERVANFLLDLSARIERRGYAADFLNLPMSRNEIANYLGLAVETVSRAFSKLQRDKVIASNGRVVEILDFGKLSDLSGSCVTTHHGKKIAG